MKYLRETAKGTYVALAILALTSCSESDAVENIPRPEGQTATQRTGVAVHPSRANVVPSTEATANVGKDRIRKSTLGQLASRLSDSEHDFSIGKREGSTQDMLGRVGDVSASSEQSVHVLDSRQNSVKTFDFEGTLLHSFGRKGDGQIKAPEALEQGSDGSVVVIDRANKLKVFRKSAGSYTHASTVDLDFVPEDFCIVNQNVFVQGLNQKDNKTIHVFSLSTGQHIRSFGEPYRSEIQLVRGQLSDGLIACDESTQTVLTMRTYFPNVYAFSTSGERKWTSVLTDFQQAKITESTDESGKSQVTFHKPKRSPVDLVSNMTSLSDGYVVLQLSRATPQSIANRKRYAELNTYLFEAATGKGTYVSNGLPPIYDATADRVYAGVNDPFPQVKVYQLPAEGDRR